MIRTSYHPFYYGLLNNFPHKISYPDLNYEMPVTFSILWLYHIDVQPCSCHFIDFIIRRIRSYCKVFCVGQALMALFFDQEY